MSQGSAQMRLFPLRNITRCWNMIFKMLSNWNCKGHLSRCLILACCADLWHLNSPLTRIPNCSLVVPIWLLTSQKKVVLTDSSTFCTLSTFSLTCTAGGNSPVVLEGQKCISVWERREQEKKNRTFDTGDRESDIYRNVLRCTVSSY